MPPKRKNTNHTGPIKKQAPTSSAVFAAKAANKAHLQAELTNLLSGQEYSKSGYVYVTVNSADNSFSIAAPESSQDPFESQSGLPYQDEQSFEEVDDEEDESQPLTKEVERSYVEISQDMFGEEELEEPNLPKNVPKDVDGNRRSPSEDKLPLSQLLDRYPKQNLRLIGTPESNVYEITRVPQAVNPGSGSQQLHDSHPSNEELSPLNLTLNTVQSTIRIPEASREYDEIVADAEAVTIDEKVVVFDTEVVVTDTEEDGGNPGGNAEVVSADSIVVAREAICESCLVKTEELRKLRKKITSQAHEIACLKDNVAFITGELQEAKDKHNFPSITFTTDSNIDMTIEELKAIDAMSQTDSIFVSNLAIRFYSTDRLKNMSVTGQPTPRFKNLRRNDGSLLYPAREKIEDHIFKFICEKLVERVGQRVGPTKIKEIAYLANEQIVRKHIAQKIGNLNKVAARRSEINRDTVVNARPSVPT